MSGGKTGIHKGNRGSFPLILFLALRYSFSSYGGQRSRAVRIVLASALSLAVLMMVVSVMLYLQNGRFERIREFSSFDLVLEGDVKDEMEKLYPDASVFVYGETEVLGDGEAYTLRYIGNDYDCGIDIDTSSGLSVPYSVFYRYNGSMPLTMLRRGSSALLLPRTDDVPIGSAYIVPPSAVSGLPFIFLPIDELDDPSLLRTAVKGAGSGDIEALRAEGFRGQSWKEQEAGLYSAFLAERVMMYALLSLLFVIILVSERQSVNIFISSRRKERAELIVMGMPGSAVSALFILSFLIVLAAAIVSGLILSLVMLPAAEAAVRPLFGEAELHLPVTQFAAVSAVMAVLTVLFSIMTDRKERRLEISEVLAGE